MSPAAEPKPEAPPELLVLQRWEEHATWLIEHSDRWPKLMGITTRAGAMVLELLDSLVVALFRQARRQRLEDANLLRLAKDRRS